jgi:hypothetical protein
MVNLKAIIPRPAPEVIQAQAKHWYIYSHQYLRIQPPDQDVMVAIKNGLQTPSQARYAW